MSRRINYSLNKINNHNTSGILYNNKKSLFLVTLLTLFSISTSLLINVGIVNAQLNFDDFMKQTQDNIQSTIEKNNNNNNNNDNCNSNISIQSQTNDNGKTTSTTRNSCDDKTTTSTSTNNGQSNGISGNLNGTISSSEIDQNNGTVINSLYGNWSLYSRDNGSKDFNATLTQQPYRDLGASTIDVNKTISPTSILQNNNNNKTSDLTLKNTSTYELSNFQSNSVQQQNNDVTYSGKINVIQEINSNNATVSDETNNFNAVGVSISIIDNKILIVNFDSQSPLYKEFENIPIVGLVK